MAELVRPLASRLYARSDNRRTDDRSDSRACSEAADRRICAQKQCPASAGWTARLQVLGDRFADLDWQRQYCGMACLPKHSNGAGLPIDAVQGKRDDLAGAQTQASQ
jgi:hypothetical protein